MYTETIIKDKEHCLQVMKGMEEAFRAKDENYIIHVLREEGSLVLRIHAVCMLANIGTEKSVGILSDILVHDPDPLVRHEAAFSLGQMGVSSGNDALAKAARNDPDPVVRHESAAALGSIGSETSRRVLEEALKDKEEIVRNSAETSLFNLDFLKKYDIGTTAKDRAPRP